MWYLKVWGLNWYQKKSSRLSLGCFKIQGPKEDFDYFSGTKNMINPII